MSNIRCTHCGRFYPKKEKEDKCGECQKQFRSIFESISKRYGIAIKRLAER